MHMDQLVANGSSQPSPHLIDESLDGMLPSIVRRLEQLEQLNDSQAPDKFQDSKKQEVGLTTTLQQERMIPELMAKADVQIEKLQEIEQLHTQKFDHLIHILEQFILAQPQLNPQSVAQQYESVAQQLQAIQAQQQQLALCFGRIETLLLVLLDSSRSSQAISESAQRQKYHEQQDSGLELLQEALSFQLSRQEEDLSVIATALGDVSKQFGILRNLIVTT
jgi:hypothetical protein